MDRDAVLLHQVHPLKIAADVSASLISNVLLWRHQLGAALAVRILLPLAGSGAVMTMCDVESLRDTEAGRYVLEHMPSDAVAIRLAGDAVMAVGAWRRSLNTLGLGLLIVAVGWSHGAWGAEGRARRRGDLLEEPTIWREVE
jgi:hypothetical protein